MNKTKDLLKINNLEESKTKLEKKGCSMNSKQVLPWVLIPMLIISLLLFRSSSSPNLLMLGIMGAISFFSAQTLYTYRKEKLLKSGNLKIWLKAHIYLGTIGLICILVHSKMHFNGFAGFALILSLIVVLSGFFGHYIYRQIPISIKGQVQSLAQLKASEQQIRGQIKDLTKIAKNKELLSESSDYERNDIFFAMISSTLKNIVKRYHLRRLLINNIGKKKYYEISKLYKQRLILEQQIKFSRLANNIFKKWRIFHDPLTIVLFLTILIHIYGALYYGRLING